MGGKGIFNFIKNKCPNAIKTTTLHNYNGKTLVIDTNYLLHKFIRAIRKTGDLKTPDGKLTSHIFAIMTTTLTNLNNGIIPVHIFDGIATDLKKKVLKQRFQKTINAKKELKKINKRLSEGEELSDSLKSTIIKLSKMSFNITSEIIEECCEFLQIMGLPVILSPEEADVQIALMTRSKEANIYGAIGEDSDLLIFGTPILIRNFGKDKIIQEISLTNILSSLNLTYSQFVDICILSGVDYCSSINGVGIETAYSIYKELINNPDLCVIDPNNIKDLKSVHGFSYINFDSIKLDMSYEQYIFIMRAIKYLQNKKKINIPDDYLFRFFEAKKYYIINSKGYDPKQINTKWNKPDLDKLQYLLTEKYCFNKDDVAKYVLKIKEIYMHYNNNPNPEFNSFKSYKKKIDRVKNNKFFSFNSYMKKFDNNTIVVNN